VATVSQSSIRIVCVSHELIKSRTVDDGFWGCDRLSLCDLAPSILSYSELSVYNF
jgi:hypothetical protein